MRYDFDQIIDRRQTNSIKWRRYDENTLPLWVADMDFTVPTPITEALQNHVSHGIFGYGTESLDLKELICERLWQFYQWRVTPEQIFLMPGVVCGLNAVCRAIGQKGDNILVQTPIYPPFLSAPSNQFRELNPVTLMPTLKQENILDYQIDFDLFESAIDIQTNLFLLCNPHNPVGRKFNREELLKLADICLKNDIVICSDEIHCDLVLDDKPHLPIATLSPEIAQRCISLFAPSKTFNIPALYCSFAVIQNPDLMKQVKMAGAGLVPEVNVLGITATLAAYRECEDWRQALLAYLKENREFVTQFLKKNLPQFPFTIPEATYLTWIDCRPLLEEKSPYHFFLENAKVALNDGNTFGLGGNGFVRLNFGCPRSILTEALERMAKAVEKYHG